MVLIRCRLVVKRALSGKSWGSFPVLVCAIKELSVTAKSARSGIFNSETNVKEQIKENKQIEEQELKNRDGEITRQEQNRRLSRNNEDI